MIHQLQEGGEGEGQHLPKAAGNKTETLTPAGYVTGKDGRRNEDEDEQPVHSLGAALRQTRQRPDALHVDELRRKGRVCRQLGQLFQGLQASVDAVGLDPLQELTGSTGLSERTQKRRSQARRKFSPNPETFESLEK